MFCWKKRLSRRTAAVVAVFAMGFAAVGGGAAHAAEHQDSGAGNEAASRDSRNLTDLGAYELEITPDEGPFAGENKVNIKGATPGFVQLSAGYYSALGVTNGGLMYGWGQNTLGWLGNDTTTNTITPTQVVTDGALKGVALTKVAIRYQHTLALSEDGRVFAWGRNQQGQLGNGTTTNSAVPVEVERGQIPDGVKLIDIGAGANWSAALGDDGQVYVWGLNEDDAGNLGLGTGSLDGSLTPVPIKKVPGEKFIQLAVGIPAAAAVTESGKVYTWGWSNLLGNGTPIVGQVEDKRSLEPVQAIFPEDVKITHVELPASRAYAMSAFALALDDQGQVWSWGLNNWGQLGNGTTIASPVPVLVQGLEGKTVKQIANSGRTAMALTEDNELYVWGSNNTGQLGIGPANASTKQTTAIPTNQSGVLKDVQITYIAGATGTMYALGEDGVIYSWGESQYGAAGNGGTVTTGSPGLGPHYGNLSYVEFHKTKVFPNDSTAPISQRFGESSDGNDTTLTDVVVPPYPGGKPADRDEVPVAVTGKFDFFAGSVRVGEPASWPIGKYTYVDRVELEWADDTPTATPLWDGSPKVGSQVEYTFTGVNTGTLPLEALGVTDEGFSGEGDFPAFTCSPNPVPAGEEFTCTAYYALSEEDLASGSLDLKGDLTGKYGSQTVKTGDGEREVKVPLVPEAELTLNKTVSDPEVFAEGKNVTYSFEIRNSGDISVKNVEIDELDFGGTGPLGGISCDAPYEYPIGSLGIGETAICTADYTLTQDDVDHEGFINKARASGSYMADNSRQVASDPSTAELTGQPIPELDFTISSDFNCNQMDPDDPQVCKNWQAGESFDFILKVTNNGAVTLDNVQVNPGAFNGVGALGALSCDPALGSELKPGESMLCELPYTLGQDDVDGLAGALTLAGSAEGSFKGVTAAESDVYPLNRTPITEIGLVKSQSVEYPGPWEVGASNTYYLEVTNLGTTTVNNIELVDDVFTGTGGVPELSCTSVGVGAEGSATIASLAPGDSVTCSFTYALTQDDVNTGKVSNHASVSGTALNGGDAVTDDADAVDWIGKATSKLGLVKTVTIEPDPFKAGAEVQYTFEVTNLGPATALDVRVEDNGPMVDGMYGAGDWTGVTCRDGQDDFDGVIDELPSGESTTCQANYTLTQQDADAATITNHAEANGTDPSGNPAEFAEDDASAGPGPEEQINNAQLTLSVSDGEITDPKIGAEVTFQVEVENTGIVTVNDVDLDLPDGFTASCTPNLPATFTPGDKAQCEVRGVLSNQAMLDAGSLTLEAVAVGNYQGQGVPSNEDSGMARWTVPPTPEGEGSQSGGEGTAGLAVTGAAITGILVLAGALLTGGLVLTRGRKTRGIQ